MTQNDKQQLIIEWEDPLPHLEKAMSSSGLEYMQAFINGEIPNAPIAQLMGFKGRHVEEGRVAFEGVPDERHYNPIGTVHGGFAATLLDSALACAVHTTLPQGMIYTTAQLNINYTRALRPNTGKVICEARVVHRGNRMATAEATLKDEAGKLYAHGTTTCLIFPLDV